MTEEVLSPELVKRIAREKLDAMACETGGFTLAGVHVHGLEQKAAFQRDPRFLWPLETVLVMEHGFWWAPNEKPRIGTQEIVWGLNTCECEDAHTHEEAVLRAALAQWGEEMPA